MEEYIKKLLEQVRFEKAHKSIADELRAHIEDQIEVNISDGMEKEAAEKRAVEDMGDPVEAGIALDKVHRPQIAWGVIIAALVVGMIGIIIRLFLSKVPSMGPSSYSAEYSMHSIFGNVTVGPVGWHIYNVIRGIVVMLFLYLIDYTTVAKYSKIATVILLGFYSISTLIYKKLMLISTSYSEIPDSYLYLYDAFKWAGPLVFLLVPLYAGIIYKYKGQKYKGLLKSLIWMGVIGIGASGYYQEYRAIVIVICLLAELTIAIKKEWIKVPKIPVIAMLWSVILVVPVVLVRIMYEKGLINEKQMYFAWSLLASDTSKNNAKEVLSGVKAFGSGNVRYMGGELTVSTRNLVVSQNYNNFDYENYMMTKIAAIWGVVLVLAIIAAVAALIVFGFVSTAKTKNQLGVVMGSGCMMWLTINALLNMLVGLGVLPDYRTSTFFPFIATHKVVASYALLGIILSIYKYKNAYPKHVDIGFRKKR